MPREEPGATATFPPALQTDQLARSWGDAWTPERSSNPTRLIMEEIVPSSRKRDTWPVLLSAILLFTPDIAQPASQAPPRPGLAISPLGTGAGCIIQSSYKARPSAKGNFEVVVLEGNELVHYWRPNDDVRFAWRRGEVISRRATGPGCIIQSTLKSGGAQQGNFEVVVQEGNRLAHYWHDNSKPHGPWHFSELFGTDIRSGPSFIQSTLKAVGSQHGNFELVVREGSQLVHYWRDNRGPIGNWKRSDNPVGPDATGGGTIIQSTMKATPDAPGNFEVLYQRGEAIAHYWHDNRSENNAWVISAVFASAVTGAPSLIQSSYGANPATGVPGNLEAVVAQGTTLAHWYRPVSTGGSWTRSANNVAEGVRSAGSIIQSSIADPGQIHGNFEVVALAEQARAPPDSKVEGGWADYHLVHYFHPNSSASGAWRRAQIVSYRGRSEKICQLTGDVDRETKGPTKNSTGRKAKLGKTDLGYPVDDGTTMTFYFGDSRDENGIGLRDEWAYDDAVATSRQTSLPSPGDCLEIQFVLSGDKFARLTVDQQQMPNTPRHFQGLFNVPSSGFTVGGTEYALFWTNHCPFPQAQGCPKCPQPGLSPKCRRIPPNVDFIDRFGRATLTEKIVDVARPATFKELYSLSDRFNYTASLNSDLLPAIPSTQRLGVFVFGMDLYRESYPLLAYVPSQDVRNLGAWKYFVGLNTDGTPNWTADPGYATPVFSDGDGPRGCIGEFHISWIPPLQRWLMLYNCEGQSQINEIRARFAYEPWGKWSEPTVIFYPTVDKAYCRYMHNRLDPTTQIGLDPTCADDLGGDNGSDAGSPYAPYILSRFTRATTEGVAIYFLVSTWNPYQVVVMRANLTSAP